MYSWPHSICRFVIHCFSFYLFLYGEHYFVTRWLERIRRIVFPPNFWPKLQCRITCNSNHNWPSVGDE
jgi:hypothetical protein